jgi:hypothetical protein
MIYTISRFAAGLTLASLTASMPYVGRAAEPALDRLVPADAAVAFALEDVPGLLTRLGQSPMGRAWDDPEIGKFLAPLFAHPEYLKFTELVKNETGHTPVELLGFATGDVLFTVPVSSLKITKSDFDADALLAIEVGDNEAKIRELIAQQQARQKVDATYVESAEDYNGVTLHTVVPVPAPVAGDEAHSAVTDAPADKKSLVWALHQGRWLLASDRVLVTGALDALAAGGRSPSLSSASAYRAVIDRAGGRPDYAFLVDFQSVYPVFAAGMEAARDPSEPPNAMGIEPANIIKALGLDTLGVLSGSGTQAADGSSAGDFVFTHGEPRGLVKLLAYRDGPVARPEWVPASWINVSSQNFSIPDLYAELEQILDRVSPMLAGMALGQVRAFDRQLNIDLKRDFIGNFGTSILSGIAPPVGSSADNPPSYDEMEQFFAVSLADAAAFERTLEAIKGHFLPPEGGPLTKREYLGRMLHVFTPPQGTGDEAKGFAYAIADGWLLVGVGSSATVEAAIQGMNKPDAATSFWARPDVRAAIEATPASAFSVQFADLRTLGASLAALAVKMQSNQVPDSPPFVDASSVPGVATFAKYFSYVVTHGERRTDGFYFKTTTPPVEK